ncbi:hypothetical protein GCM10011416_01900 [Polaribacter pacificus]|uniref:Por secretion system C-terminal sorting domain-containing protein n=1 Tax=Polaribacter pacificus TaxID=1775173 RepID=A0A917HSR2_9FLAO|nr:LamG-like jellyroll fold domain-containing protein [Polaribacter pacificus]GGG89107.1 hypothetical protein GCM10011416_01900 [Polaribacter pacificus]
MKIRLLLLLLFVSIGSFAQYSTNGLIAQYGFDSGTVFIDGANGQSFTQNGTAMTQISDRMGTASKAIRLNGDYLTRANLTAGSDITYAFWVKTSTVSNDLKTIIDDSQKNITTNSFTGFQTGYSIMLQQGKIVANVRMNYEHRFTGGNTVATKTLTSGLIADGNWHHVVVRFNSSSRSGSYSFLGELYIDGSLYQTESSGITARTLPVFDTAGDVAIGNNRNNTLGANFRYNDAIDDILVYNRALTATEISSIANYNFCTVIENDKLTASNVTATNIDVNVAGTQAVDIAYHDISQPLSSAIIVTNVAGGSSTSISGTTAKAYKVYVRKNCGSGSFSAWSPAVIFKNTGIPTYVKSDATGNNDGSSWANAFTDITTAINESYAGGVIWIASGTYKPHASSRDVYYTISKENLKIYGGFAGTETALNDRVFGANETILSGDLNNDDVNVSSFVASYANTTRNADNSYHIIQITATGNNLLLDGLTISDAHNNVSATERGGAIVKDKAVAKLTLKNCIIKDNLSRNDNAGLLAEFELNNTTGTRGALLVENSKFINNMSRWGSGIYSFVRANSNVDITVANTLFDGNITADLSASLKGLGGSASWFRVISNGSDLNLTLVNNTYVNHSDIGTGEGLNNFTKAVVAISKGAGITSTFNARVSNSIFWDNIAATNGSKSRSITDLYKSPINSLTVTNSLDELSFNDDSISSKTGNINSDPSFNADYSLKGNSPAINVGINSAVIGATDLLNNKRIFDTTVDMGAFEFGSSAIVYRSLSTVANNGTVAINPNSTSGIYADGASVVLTATPSAGYEFDGFVIASGSGSFGLLSSSNPLTITMDADKTVTAKFKLIRHQLTITAANGTVTTNPNPVNGTYADGASVTLTATPDAGYGFVNWSGDASGTTNSITVTMNADTNIVANFSATASISDLDKLSFTSYPNPTKGAIKIITAENIKSIIIYNLIGKEVKAFKTKDIDISTLPLGVYILKVETENGKIGIRKIIKK